MEKEFIPYEQSLELEELNAYIECFGFYWFNGSSNIWVLETKEYEDEYSKTISSPTFSQAFRWFREKCGFEFHIARYRHTSVKYYQVYLDDVLAKHSYSFGKSLTYEEAELECLKKLIEIVKRKK